jgi:hypothetical protein
MSSLQKALMLLVVGSVGVTTATIGAVKAFRLTPFGAFDAARLLVFDAAVFGFVVFDFAAFDFAAFGFAAFDFADLDVFAFAIAYSPVCDAPLCLINGRDLASRCTT